MALVDARLRRPHVFAHRDAWPAPVGRSRRRSEPARTQLPAYEEGPPPAISRRPCSAGSSSAIDVSRDMSRVAVSLAGPQPDSIDITGVGRLNGPGITVGQPDWISPLFVRRASFRFRVASPGCRGPDGGRHRRCRGDSRTIAQPGARWRSHSFRCRRWTLRLAGAFVRPAHTGRPAPHQSGVSPCSGRIRRHPHLSANRRLERAPSGRFAGCGVRV